MRRRELAALWKLASLQMQIHLLETEAREDLERKGERAVGLVCLWESGQFSTRYPGHNSYIFRHRSLLGGLC